MSNVLVKAEGVSKKFCRNLKKSLWYGLRDLGNELMGQNHHKDVLRADEFWAVDGVSFELKRGECLGLIGANGAGKSTLLKMLNGLVKPDKGRIEIEGRVGALIELGTGFNPILTGRENIYISGAVLGFTKEEIDRKFDEIVEFAEISSFLDTPFQNYSSGMKVRLGFAVASQMNPDILIIDEVLAVGDVGFRAKCYNRISEVMKDTAVILVTHSIPHVDRYCNRIMLMDKGCPVDDTAIGAKSKGQVIQSYYDLFKKESGTVKIKEGNKLIECRIMNDEGQEIDEIEHGGALQVSVKAELEPEMTRAIAHLAFHNRELQVVATCFSDVLSCEDGVLTVTVNISPFILNPADYKVTLLVFDEEKQQHLIWCNANWDLRVIGKLTNYGSAALCFDGVWCDTAKEG